MNVGLTDIVFSGDEHEMNWIRPDFSYAEVRLPAEKDRMDTPLRASVQSRRNGDVIETEVTIRNVGDDAYFVKGGDIGITLPLEDRYDLGHEQGVLRCTAHLFCSGTSSYVMARRMSGKAPHLGLVLTSGNLDSYSIDRDVTMSSNDRGCFILHPAPFVIPSGGVATVGWTIFPFTDTDDFYAKAGRYSQFLRVSWDRYVLFPGERAVLSVQPSFDAQVVSVNGVKLARSAEGRFEMDFRADAPGEYRFLVEADGESVTTRILVKSSFAELVEKRCRFIATNQQYTGPVRVLQGSLLVYDSQDEQVYFSKTYDLNAGRERVGMGILLATYLRSLRDGVLVAAAGDTQEKVRRTLDAYAEFVRRELVDVADGKVFNDCGRDDSYQRLYNAPWFATLFVTLYRLDGNVEDLLTAVRIIRRYYAEGGASFYPVEMPVVALCEALGDAQLVDELGEMKSTFLAHARRLIEIGTVYLPSEVNYEQSIVAPAVEVLLQTAIVTGESWLIEAAQPHLVALEQFQGMQPDYHLHEVAVRHWDGFWFGKNKHFGDTFPHHWSALSGNAFAHVYEVTGLEEYRRRAAASFRGVLPMIFDNGMASCAYVFPRTVNGRPSAGFDPYVNDQDWGLYFALRQLMSRPEMLE